MTTIVKTSQLSCQSGYRYLLKDINWEVMQGERWVVFGMNGSGKTTLLSIISGYKKHTHGDLEVFGQHYSNENILEIRRNIGWVSSSFFDQHYSRESALNIVLAGKFGTLGLDYQMENQDVVRAKLLLREFHLIDKINRPFNTMSKGERQNVLIARALFTQPKILILDEPSAGLDIYARAYLLATIRKLAEDPALTIIYVTHYTEEIIDIFDHGILLKNGQIFAQGTMGSLFTDMQMSAFIDYPVQVTRQKNHVITTELTITSHIRDLQ